MTSAFTATDSPASAMTKRRAAEPIRLMPLGDSLTRGLFEGGAAPGGYRTRLHQRISSAGYACVFVGSAADNPDSENLPHPSHEGHGGQRIDEALQHIELWLDAAEPDLILMHLGTNDIAQNHDLPHLSDRLETLVGRIVERRPTADLIVAEILRCRDSQKDAQVRSFNSAARRIVETQAWRGRRVRTVDMYQVLEISDLVDSFHPAKPGYDKMADAWFDSILPLLSKNKTHSTPHPLPRESTQLTGS